MNDKCRTVTLFQGRLKSEVKRISGKGQTDKILSPRLEVPDTDSHVPTWWEISEKILSAPKCSVLFDGTHVGFGSELDTHVVRKLPHVGVRITRKHFSFLD